ncbi:hypothetical protein EMIT0158MI4_80122 [Burkholderia ambifaria]
MSGEATYHDLIQITIPFIRPKQSQTGRLSGTTCYAARGRSAAPARPLPRGSVGRNPPRMALNERRFPSGDRRPAARCL